MSSLLAVTLLLAGVIIIPVAFLIASGRKKQHLEDVRNEPFPDEWSRIIKKRFPLYGKIPGNLIDELNGDIRVFLEKINFEGCDGFEITLEVKLVIAAQACVLLLNRTLNVYPLLTTVLVYPTTILHSQPVMFESQRTEGDVPVSGLSYSGGIVTLSWKHVVWGGTEEHDGHNVVFHEFAHQLDNESGMTDGIPALNAEDSREWVDVGGEEFSKFIQKVAKHRKDVIDEYGATNPAEFFAVCSETFFERPLTFKQKHTTLFDMLSAFYRVDPREWR